MNILKRELKSKRKTLIIWTIIIVSFCLLGFSEAGAFMGEESIQDLMSAFPDELMKAFAMDTFELSTPEGYYGIIVSYIALALAIYSVMTSCSTIVSEERDKTVEFSLVLPIKRHQLLSAKLMVVFIYGIMLNIIAAICAIVFGNIYDAGSDFYTFVLLSSIAIFLIQFIFTALGFCIGCLFKKHKRAGSLSVSILLATYFASMLTGMHEKLDFLKYLTPFKFFDFQKIYQESAIDVVYIIITVSLSIVLIAAGYIGYQKRDIHV